MGHTIPPPQFPSSVRVQEQIAPDFGLHYYSSAHYHTRPVVSQPGGGGGGWGWGSELGWVEHYIGPTGYGWAVYIMAETDKESSSNRRGWLISHSGAYFHL